MRFKIKNIAGQFLNFKNCLGHSFDFFSDLSNPDSYPQNWSKGTPKMHRSYLFTLWFLAQRLIGYRLYQMLTYNCWQVGPFSQSEAVRLIWQFFQSFTSNQIFNFQGFVSHQKWCFFAKFVKSLSPKFPNNFGTGIQTKCVAQGGC